MRAEDQKPGIVVVQANDADPESEEAAIADAKASGLALEGGQLHRDPPVHPHMQEGFTPYRIEGGWGTVLRQTAENGRKIYPGPNCPPFWIGDNFEQ